MIDRKITAPSSPPISGSQQRSGWGIIPNTLPRVFTIPAMLFIEPLGLDGLDVVESDSQYLKTTWLLASR
jgi:hypothetical protein